MNSLSSVSRLFRWFQDFSAGNIAPIRGQRYNDSIMKENKIPFKLKENIELTITGLGSSGEGVGKVSGFTFFVPGALPRGTDPGPGDPAEKSYGQARLLKLLVPSPDRVKPPLSGVRPVRRLPAPASVLSGPAGPETPDRSGCHGTDRPLYQTQRPGNPGSGRPLALPEQDAGAGGPGTEPYPGHRLLCPGHPPGH